MYLYQGWEQDAHLVMEKSDRVEKDWQLKSNIRLQSWDSEFKSDNVTLFAIVIRHTVRYLVPRRCRSKLVRRKMVRTYWNSCGDGGEVRNMGQRVLYGVLYSTFCDFGDRSLTPLLSYETTWCLLVISGEEEWYRHRGFFIEVGAMYQENLCPIVGSAKSFWRDVSKVWDWDVSGTKETQELTRVTNVSHERSKRMEGR